MSNMSPTDGETRRSYQFGECEVYPELNTLVVNGTTIGTQPRAMEVLDFLVQNRDRVVTTAELLELFWPGRIVEESTIHRQISRIRSELGDSARASNYIKTISKRGYQAVAAVTPLPSRPNEQPTEPTTTTPSSEISSKGASHAGRRAQSNRTRLAVFGLTFVLLGCFGLIALWQPGSSEPEGITTQFKRESIAVLPLTTRNSSEQLDAIALGVVDRLLDQLAQEEHINVSSRTTAEQLAKQNLDIIEIGKQLDVEYVLEGSIQQLGTDYQVIAQLIRVSDGFHVLSKTIQRSFAEGFDGQQATSHKLARLIHNKMDIDLKRRYPGEYDIFDGVDPEAIKLFIQSIDQYRDALLNEGGDMLVAMQLVERAVAVDPSFSEAQLELAWNYIFRINPSLSVEESSTLSHAAIAKVLEKEPDSLSAQFSLIQALTNLDLNYAEADQLAEAAIRLEPNSPWWHVFRGVIAAREGRDTDAFRLMRMERALGVNNSNPEFIEIWIYALYRNANFGEAIEAADVGLSLLHTGKQRASMLVTKANIMIKMGDIEAASLLLEEAWEIGSREIPEQFGYGFARTNQPERARAALLAGKEKPNNRAHFVAGYSALGELDKAIDYIRTGIDDHDVSVLSEIRSNVWSPELLEDSRFQALLNRLEEKEQHTAYYVKRASARRFP